jgi:hypothetical protein
MGARRALFRYVLPVLVLGTTSCRCPCECEAATASFVVEAPDGGVVSNVAAFIVVDGGPSVQLDCTPSNTTTVCYWSGTPEAGGYTVQVGAPGYQTADIAVTLSIVFGNPGASCSCSAAKLSPDTVMLIPGDGGP